MAAWHYKTLEQGNKAALEKLFESTFTESDGEQEGRAVGGLAAALASGIDDETIICLGAFDEAALIGCIFFSRLQFDAPVRVYMLSPVAVATACQGRGVGQGVIRHGLDQLRARSVAVVVTYGDPAFYSRVGFAPLSKTVLQAPHRLSMPQGWLGQSLTAEPIPVLAGRPDCVQPFNDPGLW